MNLSSKIVIVVGTLGSAVGALTYLVQKQFNKTNDIESKLIKENYELLSSEATQWTDILASYKATITSNQSLKFEGFESTASANELPRLCSLAIKLDLSKDANGETYKKAKKWCTKPRTLTNLLSSKGYRFLSLDLSNDEEKEDWDKIVDLYNSAESAKKFDSLDLLTGSALKKDKATRDKLRTKCASLKDKKHHEKDFEKVLDQAQSWCSIKEG